MDFLSILHTFSLFFPFFLALPVVPQKLSQPVRSDFQFLHPGKVHNPKMVWLLPVKAAAIDKEYLLFPQEI